MPQRTQKHFPAGPARIPTSRQKLEPGLRQSTSTARLASHLGGAEKLSFRPPEADTQEACRHGPAGASRLPLRSRNASRIASNRSLVVGRIVDSASRVSCLGYWAERINVTPGSQKEHPDARFFAIASSLSARSADDALLAPACPAKQIIAAFRRPAPRFLLANPRPF